MHWTKSLRQTVWSSYPDSYFPTLLSLNQNTIRSILDILTYCPLPWKSSEATFPWTGSPCSVCLKKHDLLLMLTCTFLLRPGYKWWTYLPSSINSKATPQTTSLSSLFLPFFHVTVTENGYEIKQSLLSGESSYPVHLIVWNIQRFHERVVLYLTAICFILALWVSFFFFRNERQFPNKIAIPDVAVRFLAMGVHPAPLLFRLADEQDFLIPANLTWLLQHAVVWIIEHHR